MIILGPVCKLRKIFTMRNCLAEIPDTLNGEECLPQDHMFSSGVDSTIQVIDSAMLLDSLGLACSSDGGRSGADSSRKINKTERSPHVAFGTRVPLPLPTVHVNANLPNDGNAGCIKERQVQTPPMHGKSTKSSNHRSPETTGQVGYLESMESKTPFLRNKVGAISHSEGMLSEEVPEITSFVKESRQIPLEYNIRGCNTLSNYHESVKPEELYKEEKEPDKSTVEKCKLVENNNHGLQHSQRLNKKKEESQVLTNIKSFKKETNKTKEFKHTGYVDSPPGSPPCGWEGCSSSGASDDMHFVQGFSSFSRMDECHQSGEVSNGLSNETKISVDGPKHRNTDWQGDMSPTGRTRAGLTVQQLSSLHFLKRKHGRGIINLPIAGGQSHRYNSENNDLQEDRDFHFASDDDLSEVQSIGSGCSGATADLRASLDCSRHMPEEISHPIRQLETNFSDCPIGLPPQGVEVIHDPYEEELWVVHEENVITEYKDPASEAALDDPPLEVEDIKDVSNLDEDAQANQVLQPSVGHFQSAKRYQWRS